MPSQARTRLKQTGRFGQLRRFELIGGRRLRVSERSRRKSRSYMIDVVAIDPNSRVSVRVPRNWLGLVVAGVTAALVGWMVLKPGGNVLALVFVTSGLASAVGLIMVVRDISKRRVFVSCYARLPLLDLEVNQPDAVRFNQFVAQLEQQINDAHKQLKLDESQHVAGELRMLRRLTEAGVFEPDVYQRAKSRLLEKF